MSIYGPLVSYTAVRQAITDNLQDWLPSYLGEVGDCNDMGDTTSEQRRNLATPRWGVSARDLERRPNEKPPFAAVLISDADPDPDSPDGRGVYAKTLQVDVETVVGSTHGFEATQALSEAYANAVELAMLQKPPGSPVGRVEFTGTAFDDLDGDFDRTMRKATCSFLVHVPETMSRRGGPLVPEAPDPREPSDDAPVVLTHSETLSVLD